MAHVEAARPGQLAFSLTWVFAVGVLVPSVSGAAVHDDLSGFGGGGALSSLTNRFVFILVHPARLAPTFRLRPHTRWHSSAKARNRASMREE